MTVFVVLNPASLSGGGEPRDDVSLLGRLAWTFLALRAVVVVRDEGRVRACVPADVWRVRLPGGSDLPSALKELAKQDLDLSRRLRLILTQACPFDEHGGIEGEERTTSVEVIWNGLRTPALCVAWIYRGIAWSADRPEWRRPQIPVDVVEGKSVPRLENVVNAWCSNVLATHRQAMSSHLDSVLPAYENPGHHDPEAATPEKQANYIKFRRKKSELPRNAERLLRYAVRDPRKVTAWWALCECGFFHRYDGTAESDGWPIVHWNGTTDEKAYGNQDASERITVDKVPKQVRAELERLGPVNGCGCRSAK